MSSCPICNTPMNKERREIEKGIFARVEVCPKCQDEWLDLKAHEELYQYYNRKTFKIGGSLAVRIPKEMAEIVGIKEGTRVKFAVKDNKLVIEAVA